MPVEAIRKCCHDLINRMQEVLGYLEMKDYPNAMKAVRKTIPLAYQLQHLVRSLEEERRR